jgi:hypothetical protein
MTTSSGRWRLVALCLVILLSGAALGAAGALYWFRGQALRLAREPRGVPAAIVARMRSRLALTDEQATRVEAVLRRRQERLLALRREVQPRVEAELDEAQREVAAELTPEQAAAWNARVEHLRKTWLPPLEPPSTR